MLRQVKTENGWVKGIPAADPRITAFKGIPYAKPPVGELRWKAPQPAEDWEGVRECYTFGPIAMQAVPGTDPNDIYTKEWHVDSEVEMSEDCLHLNIWTPAKTGDENLPVMIWYFGGGLVCGYPSEMEFDGERIARRGVILVSVNYRCNVFGFLAHPELTAEDPEFPTNFGHLDQRAGILWVKRNIKAFGGDPDNITIFGQSAGGGSTFVHCTSPMNEGLFQRAICHSSGGMLPFSNQALTLEEAEEKGKLYFSDLGISTLAEARALDAKTLYAVAHDNRKYGWGTVKGDKFMPDLPSRITLHDQLLKVDIMTGNTIDEYHVKPNCKTIEEFEAYAKNLYGDKADEFLAICRKGTSTDEEVIANGEYSRFGVGNLLWTDVNTRLNHNRMYFYHFNPEMPGDNAGSFHSSCLWFAFETLAKCWRPFTGKHYDLARQMCNYWTNFARTGDPNGLDADGTPMPEWIPVTEESKAPIFFGDTIYMDYTPRTELEEWMARYYEDRLEKDLPVGFMRP